MLIFLVCELQLQPAKGCTRYEWVLCQRIKRCWQPRSADGVTSICFSSAIRSANARDNNVIRRPNPRLKRSTSSVDGTVNVVAPTHQ